MKDIDSPTGIDLRPDPPNAVRLSKRAGIIALVIVTAVDRPRRVMESQLAANGLPPRSSVPIRRGSQRRATPVK